MGPEWDRDPRDIDEQWEVDELLLFLIQMFSSLGFRLEVLLEVAIDLNQII